MVVDVVDQIERNKTTKAQEAYYFIKEASHLLTSWLHPENYLNFTQEEYEKKFAKCETWEESLSAPFTTPGVCRAKGGRTGYSVKLISSKLLRNQQLKLGGSDTTTGPIKNPPSNSFF